MTIRSDEEIATLLADLRSAYPSRPGDGTPNEERHYRALLEEGVDPEAISTAAAAYAEDCGFNTIEPQFVKRLANWLKDRDYVGWLEERPRRREESPGAKATRWMGEESTTRPAPQVRVLDDEPWEDPFAPPSSSEDPPAIPSMTDRERADEIRSRWAPYREGGPS